MRLRLSLADKISLTIVMVGLLAILLVYSITESYKQFAYDHLKTSIQQLATLEASDLTSELQSNAIDLALVISQEDNFELHYEQHDKDAMQQNLDNQFYQYFVTAGVLKLLKLYILDTEFSLVSRSFEGLKTDDDAQIICPRLSQQAKSRRGSDKLQIISQSCLYKNHPVYAVLVPFGGLNPNGYIQVVTDLAYNLKAIEKSLAMPIMISNVNKDIIYQSRDWQRTRHNTDFITVNMAIIDPDGQDITHLSLHPEVKAFNKDIFEHRNRVMLLAVAATTLTIFIVLALLRRSTIPPLAKIHQVVEKLHLTAYDDARQSSVLFQQLLEHIISLRDRFNNGFSVMIMDLTDFHQINDQYGQSAGDQLLSLVEIRIGSILRDTDLISWIGTDSPGHRLAPSGTETRYRATIARLGGDEFGLVLPTASTREQVLAVASRLSEAFSEPFQVNNHSIHISCKIGISIFPDHGSDERELIRNADKAMHTARSNENNVAIYQTD
jgi:GGDEF domain-containing protein